MGLGVEILQCKLSDWDTRKKIVLSQVLFLFFCFFFCKWTNKIQGLTRQPLKTLKPFELP